MEMIDKRQTLVCSHADEDSDMMCVLEAVKSGQSEEPRGRTALCAILGRNEETAETETGLAGRGEIAH